MTGVQTCALPISLIHKPSVLFLDEPTTGVDPVSRKEFWDMLKKLKADGITIIVSTPYMDEATLCDKIALMLNGHFMMVDTPSGIIASYPNKLWSVASDNLHRLLHTLRSNEHIKSSFSFGESFHVTFKNDSEYGEVELKAFLESEGHTDISISAIQPKVEDCFMLLSKQ